MLFQKLDSLTCMKFLTICFSEISPGARLKMQRFWSSFCTLQRYRNRNHLIIITIIKWPLSKFSDP